MQIGEESGKITTRKLKILIFDFFSYRVTRYVLHVQTSCQSSDG